MSQRKRQMATTKKSDSGASFKRWLRLSVFIVGLGAVTVSVFMFSQPVFNWLKSKSVNNQVAGSTVKNSELTDSELTDSESSNTVKSWKVAFQNAPDF